MKFIRYLFVSSIVFSLASCTIEGPVGPTGPSGTNGANGVTNIQSATFTVTAWNTTSTPNKWVSVWADSNITNLNYDAVQVYWSTPSDTEWLALPATSIVASGDELNYGFTNGYITFIYTGNTNPAWPTAAFSTLYFNVVVIPPDLNAKYPNTNWQNAMEVQIIPEVKATVNNPRNK